MKKKKSQRGGYRPGAGRKAIHGQRMEPTGITLPTNVIELLDAMTGPDRSRSAVVLELLAKADRGIANALRKAKK